MMAKAPFFWFQVIDMTSLGRRVRSLTDTLTHVLKIRISSWPNRQRNPELLIPWLSCCTSPIDAQLPLPTQARPGPPKIQRAIKRV